jgi:hypothetical protein
MVPDLRIWAKAYVEKDNKFLNWYKESWLNRGDQYVDDLRYTTDAQIFMGSLHNHGHEMGYDFETLKFITEQTGFINVVEKEYGKSDLVPKIAELEFEDPKKYESVTIECIKP